MRLGPTPSVWLKGPFQVSMLPTMNLSIESITYNSLPGPNQSRSLNSGRKDGVTGSAVLRDEHMTIPHLKDACRAAKGLKTKSIPD
jgi:hypothetical protein